MSLHTFTTNGITYEFRERKPFEVKGFSSRWVIFVVPQGTETELGFDVQYPFSFSTEEKDNMNRDFAAIKYALENDIEKVHADSKQSSGYVINCGAEPYLRICQQF